MKERHEWIDRRLGQLGIDARQSGAVEQMREYIKLLEQEIEMTKEFLEEDKRSLIRS